MRYVDESSPWTVDAFRKYATYIKLRKERDKFLKSLREMNYREWLIDKKLTEAGGLGKTVYIHVGRGNGKTHRILEQIAELEAMGKEVHVVTLNKPEPKLRMDDIEKIKETILDWDLYCNRENQAMNETVDKYIHEQIMRRFSEDIVKQWANEKRWITTVCPDSYIFDHKTYADYAMRDLLLNPHYGIAYKKDTCFGGVICP